MAKLVTLQADAHGVFDQYSDSLDAAWVEAETLGKVSCDTRWDGQYAATVNFQTRTGSNVFAHGKGKRPADAVRAAIHEAIALGAG